MPKKEKIFPIETIGGRIQILRHKEHLSRSDLYDRIYPYGEAGSDANKEKTVFNWESGKTELNYENMTAVCRVLNCSSDYLLGLDECTNKTNQFIHDQIGLSEDVIDMMCRFANEDDWTQSMDFLLRSSDFVVYLVPFIYRLAFCTFTYVYTDLLRKSKKSDIPEFYSDEIIEEYAREEGLNQLEINDSLVHILDSLRDEATKRAKQAINSPTVNGMYEKIVERFKSSSSAIYPENIFPFHREHIDDIEPF